MRRGSRGLRLALGLSGWLGIAFGCSDGAVQATSRQEARILKVQAPVGSTYAFSIVTNMKIADGSGEAGFEGRIDEKLLESEGDEQIWQLDFKVAKSHDKGAMSGASAGFKQLDGVQLKRFADSTGQVRKMMIGDVSVPNSGTSDLVFSKKAVKVGDSWTTTVEAQGMKIEVTYTLAEYGRMSGVDAAKIEGSYNKGQAIESLEPLVFWVDLKDGKTLQATGAFRARMQGKALDTTYELKRL